MYYGLLALLLILSSAPSMGRNMSDPVYIEPFDRAAGGTVLTRATRDGILYGNPALLGLGKSWIRWAGFQTTPKITGDRENIQNLNDAVNGDNQTDDAGGEGGSEGIDLDLLSVIDVGTGFEFNLAFMNRNGGGGVFADAGLYADYSDFGNTGIPGAKIVTDVLGGAAISGAYAVTRWLHLGATQKMLYGSSKELVLTPLNFEQVSEEVQDGTSLGTGMGTDFGALLYFQDYTIDYALGLTAQNLVPVEFSDGAYPTLPQMYNLGLGIAFHTASNVIHLSAELNDLQATSAEPQRRRLHVGARLLIWERFGLAVGLYNDKPSFGIKADLTILAIGLSYYNKVIGFNENSFERDEITFTISAGI